MKRIAISIGSLTLGHAVLSVATFWVMAGLTLSRFDSGQPASQLEAILARIVAVLHWPVLSTVIARVPTTVFPGLWGYVPLLINSLLWAAVLTALIKWLGVSVSRTSTADAD